MLSERSEVSRPYAKLTRVIAAQDLQSRTGSLCRDKACLVSGNVGKEDTFRLQSDNFFLGLDNR